VRLKDYRDSRRKDFLKDYCLDTLEDSWNRERRSGKSFQWKRDNLLREYPDCANYVNSTEPPRKTDPGNNPTQLVISGHSFGGLVIYEALSHALMERAAKTTNTNGAAHYEVAESFGDFVMLVNPAFEGSLYEPLFHIATNRCYDTKQRPVMMIVTSKADSATRVAFPVGRALNTLLQHAMSPEQSDSMLHTVGHNQRYETHRLESDGVIQKKVTDNRPCPCEYLKATSNVDVSTKLMPLFKASFDNKMKEVSDMNSADIGGAPGFNPRPYGNEVMLVPVPGGECYSTADASFSERRKKQSKEALNEYYIENNIFQECMAKPGQPSPKYAARYPYLVVSTDAGVIADHNAIYNERFLDFGITFITEHISQAKPWGWPERASARNCVSTEDGLLPYEQSCWRSDGKSCSTPTQ